MLYTNTDQSLPRAEAGNTQQLVARIKRNSKYYGQTAPGAWFDVCIVVDTYYRLRGNNNNYRLGDVALGIRLDSGIVVDLTSGKTCEGGRVPVRTQRLTPPANP